MFAVFLGSKSPRSKLVFLGISEIFSFGRSKPDPGFSRSEETRGSEPPGLFESIPPSTSPISLACRVPSFTLKETLFLGARPDFGFILSSRKGTRSFNMDLRVEEGLGSGFASRMSSSLSSRNFLFGFTGTFLRPLFSSKSEAKSLPLASSFPPLLVFL